MMADEQHSLQTYISDMLALGRQVRVPFGAQAKDDDFARFENAASVVTELMALLQQHIDALERGDARRLHRARPLYRVVYDASRDGKGLRRYQHG